MPDGVPGLRHARDAHEELGHWLLASGARGLSSGELNAYAIYRPVAGWRAVLVTDCAGSRRVDIVIDRRFPASLPNVFLVDRPPLNSWPHVESDGRLCLWTKGVSFGGKPAAEIGTAALWRACELIDDGASGANREDLRSEAISYWKQALPSGSPVFLSLVKPVSPSRLAMACRVDQSVLVADDETSIRKWLRHRYDLETDQTRTFPAVYAWFEKPMLPAEYPNSLAGWRALLERHAPAAAEQLDEALGGLPDRCAVVVAAPTDNGPALMGTLVQRGIQPRGKPGEKSKLQIPGFRPGRAPAHVVTRFWRGFATVGNASVERIDAAWIHGRDRDDRTEILRNKTVAFLGCGSVGSPVASNLAAAGLGNMILIDPETLGGANVGRHALGADALRQNKARALSARIGKDYPHLESIRSIGRTWQRADEEDPGLLGSCDLIVSAIGSWPEQWALNEWHLAIGRAPPILYVWTEPHACAGHAILVGQQGGCFACGHELDGLPRCEVTDWPEGARILPEPACGGSFSPYGPIELAYINAVASELALDALTGGAGSGTHRVWTATRGHLERAGGGWTRSWIDGADNRMLGGGIHELLWPAGPCDACLTQDSP